MLHDGQFDVFNTNILMWSLRRA